VAVQDRLTMTAAEFERLAQLPKNRDKRLEFVAGEVVEVVTNSYASMIAARILARIGTFVDDHKLGHYTGADGGYMVGNDRVIPDVGFISKSRQPEPSHAPYNPLSPDLAVEVVSPTDKADSVTDKIVNYLAAGTTVWVIYPISQEAKVYTPGHPVGYISSKGELDGGAILPGFKLALSVVFAE
jgi:Uma2 family endonuclease